MKRKILCGLLVIAILLSMPPIDIGAAMMEIKESEEWSGKINGQKYFKFVPSETGYYNVSVIDPEDVVTYVSFYKSQNGEKIRGIGEVSDSPCGNGFYVRNAVYLSKGVSYNLKVDCSDGEEREMMGEITITITKSQDSINELVEYKQHVDAINNGNCVMHYVPKNTGEYTLDIEQTSEESICIDLYTMIDGNLVCIEEQNKWFYDESCSVKYYLQAGQEYYFELNYSSELDDGEEIPVYVQLSKGKEVESISIIDIVFDDLTCNSSWSSPWVESIKLQVNYVDGTNEIQEYTHENIINKGISVQYIGEVDSDGNMKKGNQKVQVTYLGSFSDETPVYVKTKVEALNGNAKLEMDKTVIVDVSYGWSGSYLLKPTNNGYYSLHYYKDYGDFEDCMESYQWRIWDSNDNEVIEEEEGYKLKAEETYYFYVTLNGMTENMTDFRFFLSQNENHKHTYGDWKVTNQPTESEYGEKVRICSSCEYQERQKIDKINSSQSSQSKNNVLDNPKARDDVASMNSSNVVQAPPIVKGVSVKKKKKKSIAISWKKAVKVSGYEVQFADNSKFNKKRRKLVKNTQITLKNLKKKKYYIRVRAYRIDGKKKVYGKWCKIKKLKIKK